LVDTTRFSASPRHPSPGGNALKYYSSVRLDVRRKESLRDNAGITVKVKVGRSVEWGLAGRGEGATDRHGGASTEM